jgi:hypothetical protein
MDLVTFLTCDPTTVMDLRRTPAKVSQHPHGMTLEGVLDTRDLTIRQNGNSAI